jgi:hypothetical protein
MKHTPAAAAGKEIEPMKYCKNPWCAFVIGIVAGIAAVEVLARTTGKGTPPSQIVMPA